MPIAHGAVRLCTLAVSLSLSACTPAAAPTGPAPYSARAPVSAPGLAAGAAFSRDRLRAEEVRAPAYATLYEAVARLRPAWLSAHGAAYAPAAAGVQVYVDGLRAGGPDALRGVNPADVVSVEHLDGTSAMTRFGTGHADGAILVGTVARPRG
jgi:hypothetical protein